MPLLLFSINGPYLNCIVTILLKEVNYLTNPKDANWYNETLEITHGFGKNFEIGFYTFTGFDPNGSFQYLGNQIRPRVTVPDKWKWSFGASLSVEFGFFRPDDTTDFFWQGELRPIIDKTYGNWYFAFNPNIDFVVSGDDKGVGFSPQFKAVYTIKQKVDLELNIIVALESSEIYFH